MNEMQLSSAVEELLVTRNLRDMRRAREALPGGYFLRAAKHLHQLRGTVIIATGFPVSGTFETDGPVGAMALYSSLAILGARPVIACGAPLSNALRQDYEVLELHARDLPTARTEAAAHLNALQPQAVVAIESPGLAADGRYYNMRGEDISEFCTLFDPFISQANCPTIAIGDGGNEAGMGNIAGMLADLDIRPSVTCCDELLVADVSNWGAYGLIAFLGIWSQRDLLADIAPLELLDYLSTRGSVDGVTGQNTLTEDGLPAEESLSVIQHLRQLTQFSRRQQPPYSTQ
jgi:D-glutamate cyclase-like protein